jgi:murein DD-endopeptidase MepM/ murein hydrolase activator NlpD
VYAEERAPRHGTLARKEPLARTRHLIHVRKLILFACAAWLVVALFAYAERAGVGVKLSGLALPFKAALLYAKPPDTKLAVPVEGVHAGQIKNSWHAPRSGGRLHEGQDIFAPRGTAVRSATEGYVVRMGESPLGGNTVFVLGAGGRTYYYAHLDSYAPDAEIGAYVTPQTVLGYVGATGNATGTSPHLHFGVYTSSGAIDPLPLLQKDVS